MSLPTNAPLYDTVESNEEHIKKLETLLDLIEKQKRFRETYRIYKAGIKENLIQNVQALEKAKTEVKKDQEQDLKGDDIIKAYEDLGLFVHHVYPIPQSWRLTNTIEQNKVKFYLHKSPVTIYPFKKTLVYKDIVYPLDPPRMIDLLKGEIALGKYTKEELQIYLDLMEKVGAAKKSKRYTNIKLMIEGKPEELVRRVPGERSERPPSPSSSIVGETGSIREGDDTRLEELIDDDPIAQEREIQLHLKYFKWSFDKNYKKIIEEKIKLSETSHHIHYFPYEQAFKKTKDFLQTNRGISESLVEKVSNRFLEEYPEATYKPPETVPRYYKGEGLLFLPDDPYELFERLKILVAAHDEGHTNVFNEKHAILKRLLEKHFITKEQYKQLST